MSIDYSEDKYDASQIIIKNIPNLVYQGKVCSRTYVYRFIDPLPSQNKLDQLAKNLYKIFTFKKEEYGLDEDMTIHMSVVIQRLSEYEANLSVMTITPEHSWVYIHGIRVIPKLIEKELGTIVSIQNQRREDWL